MNSRLIGALAMSVAALSCASALAGSPPQTWAPQPGVAALYDGNGNLISSAHPLPVGGGASTNAPVSFRQTCTTSAVVLPSNALTGGILLLSLTTNTGTIYIGPATVTTANGYPLVAGQGVGFGVSNSNQLYMVCSGATDVLAGTGN